MAATTSVLKLENIDKSFGPNQVLYGVDLTLKRGSIHALVGENGAGKSTLMKILAGIHSYDQGRITLDGRPLQLSTPKQAQTEGVMLMHQELSLFPEMTVTENIFAGHLLSKNGLTDWKGMQRRANEILQQLECKFSPHSRVRQLSIANQHLCEFARFLSMEPHFIILDEPTASLTENEKKILFRTIRQLCRQHQIGVLYISHRMHEIFEIADEVSVLRDGVMQGTFPIDKVDVDELTRLMIGYDLQHLSNKDFTHNHGGETLLEIKSLGCPGLFRQISFSVQAGEVVGMAGLIGARRKEIADSLFGLLHSSQGNIYVNGKELRDHSVKQAILAGMALVPDERKEQGLVLGMSCLENITLTNLPAVKKRGLLSKQKEYQVYEKYRQMLSIKASSPHQQVKQLSGGNQQKIVLAKWLFSEPKLLILNEPTRGIDVGAKAEIYRLIQKLIDHGHGVLLISSDMYELLTLSRRVIAIYEGQISAEFSQDTASEEAIIAAISKNLNQQKIEA